MRVLSGKDTPYFDSEITVKCNMYVRYSAIFTSSVMFCINCLSTQCVTPSVFFDLYEHWEALKPSDIARGDNVRVDFDWRQ